MFHEIDSFEDVIRQIALERTLFQFVEGYRGNVIDGESFYQDAVELAYAVAQDAVYMEHTESMLYFFRFPIMDEFYKLCKEHSQRNHISFKKDPYITDAEEQVLAIIECSGMVNIAYNYWIPPVLKRKRQHRFLIELGCEFYEWVELFQAVFEIRDYFKKKVEELKAELHPAPKVIVFPAPIAAVTEERKAA